MKIQDLPIVPSQGPSDAKVVIVGEAPGKNEEAKGRPFCGRAGDLLDLLLSDVGLSRGEVYITNVCQVRPPANKFAWFRTKENKPYLLASLKRVREEIRRVNPHIVICLGSEASKAVLGDGRVKARRGFLEWNEDLKTKVIVTYHPAAVLRGINLYPITLFDMKKAAEEAKTRELSKRMERKVRIVEDVDEVREILAEFHRSGRKTSFDIETTAEGIDCLSLAQTANSCIVIPFAREVESTSTGDQSEGKTGASPKRWVVNYWKENDEQEVWRLVKRLLEDPSVRKIAQNAFFDMWHLRTQLGIHVKNVYFDTMIASAMLNAEFPKDLWFLATLYTDVNFWEDTGEALDARRWNYCGYDSMVTYEVAEKQERELNEYGLRDFFYRLPMPLLPCLVRASAKGVRYDVEWRSRELKKTTIALRKEVEALHGHTGVDFNYRSHKQKCEYFITSKRIKPVIDTQTKRPTWSAEALEKLSRRDPQPEFGHMIRINKLENEINVLKTKLGEDKRLRCSYNVAGTETGRLSSSEAPDHTGSNLQNITAKFRRGILADEGCQLIKADLQQAENRIVAYLSEDPFMIDIVSSGGDIHRQIASMIFRKKPEDITKQERQLGKKIGHACNYGMGPKRLTEVVWEEDNRVMSMKEAKKLQLDYFSAFPKIQLWHQSVQRRLEKHGALENPFGRVRRFLGYKNHQLFKEAYAFLPQSAIADVVNLAFIELDKKGLDIRLQTHDELVVNVRECKVKETAQLIKKTMETTFKVGDNEVSIPVEVQVGPNWAETKEMVLDDSGIELETKVLLRRLKVIRSKYQAIIDECITISIEDPQKEMYLSFAELLDAESSAIKKTLGFLLDDPCPYTKKDHQNTRVCSKCDEESRCLGHKIIVPLGRRRLPI